jgi:hypothetical protein
MTKTVKCYIANSASLPSDLIKYLQAIASKLSKLTSVVDEPQVNLQLLARG